MTIRDLSVLDSEEADVARVLLKVKAIREVELDEYLEFKKQHNETGKKQIGEILLNLEYITETDILEYMKESNIMHMEFCENMQRQGYLSSEQMDLIRKRHEETGDDVIKVVIDSHIMTRDNFSKIFNNTSKFIRLGEWLVMKGKVTEQSIQKAKNIQSINGLEDYLVAHGYCTKKTMARIKNKVAGL